MEDTSAGKSKVFISYSRRDKDYLERLQEHLKPHVRAGTIPLWVDTSLKPGDDWKTEIEHALATVQVAVLLVSVSFLASDFVVDEELPKLLIATEERGTRIIPVILTPCSFQRTKLSRFQASNNPDKPLSGLSQYEQDLIWERVVNAVLEGLASQSQEYVPTSLLPSSRIVSPAQASCPGKGTNLESSCTCLICLSTTTFAEGACFVAFAHC